MSGKAFYLIAWILFLLILTFGFSKWATYQNSGAMVVSESGQIRRVIISPNRAHGYHAKGTINDRPVQYIIDTGATSVVIPAHLEKSLELTRGLPQKARTANGLITTYRTRISKLTIGPIQLNNISASINPHMKGEVLLGMSALKHLDIQQKEGRLILTQPVAP